MRSGAQLLRVAFLAARRTFGVRDLVHLSLFLALAIVELAVDGAEPPGRGSVERTGGRAGSSRGC